MAARLLQGGIFRGEVQRDKARLDLPVRGEDIFSLYGAQEQLSAVSGAIL